MRDTASPASSVCAKPASSVRTASGARRMRSVSFVAIPSVPSEPTNAPSRSGPLVPDGELDELAVRQHDLRREHVVDGEAVLEAVRAARVLGDVAADRADLLRGGVGRVVEALRRDRARDVEVRDARLDDDLPALDVDLEDARQARERDDDPLGYRQRAAGEPGAGAARDERDPMRVTGPDHGRHLGRALGQRDQRRDDAAVGQPVALVGAQLLGPRDQLVGCEASPSAPQGTTDRYPKRILKFDVKLGWFLVRLLSLGPY